MKTAMVCDDSSYMRSFIKKTLEAKGITVVAEVEDGITAVSKYDEFVPDIVTMDISMPGMSGMEAFKQIKKSHPDACIIVITSWSDGNIANELADMGSKGYLSKPFTEDELNNLIEKIL